MGLWVGYEMKKVNSSFFIVLLLVLFSVLIYAIQLIVFESPRDTGFYILQDFAFLPLQIAIVTVVLGRYLKSREKTERLFDSDDRKPKSARTRYFYRYASCRFSCYGRIVSQR